MEALQRLHNRGSISTGYEINNSCKFEADNSEYLERDPSSAGNRKLFTTSMWVKRTELGQASTIFGVQPSSGQSNNNTFQFGFTSDDKFQCGLQTFYVLQSNRLFKDTSAWYHIVVAVDTTQSTAADRIKLYVNGVQETSFSTQATITQDSDLGINFTEPHRIGTLIANSWYFSGYIAEMNHIDGQTLTPTEFGEFDDDSGIWKPKEADVTYGTNGFYLDYADASDLGDDESGNGNDFTENNITSADQATDTPTNNFCTINPLIPYYGSVSEGATKWLHTSGGSGWESFVATMGAGTSGKWYAEFKVVTSGSADNFIGICPIDDPDLNRGADHFPYYGSDTSLDESVGYYAANGQRYIGGGGAAYGNSWASTNIMSIAVDMDNGKLYFAKDGVWQNSGDPTSGATGTGALDVRGATKPQSLGAGNYTSGENILANYGGFTTISISSAASDANGYGTFEYAPPSGYYALCTKNLEVYG